jgi:tetratricopeptide (TPR) repeat protein
MTQKLASSYAVPFLALTASLCLCGSSLADLNAESDKPYKLQVVLDVAKHRQLTDVFVNRLKRDVRELLEAELGDLARVEVVHDHPLLKTVRARGLEKALNGYAKITPVKAHFVRLSFKGGRYELEARQHDGTTGLSTPRVGTARTSDPRLVARAAARLVSRDFGLVGTVTKVTKQTVDLTLKGGGLGVPLKRWAPADEVFAITQISKASGGLRSTPVPWAFLQVTREPQAGVCTCRLYHRFRTDTLGDQPGVLGYRCLKLSTLKGPLRMRFLDFKTHHPLDSLEVHVSATGFDGPQRKLVTDREGVLPRSGETYAHVAFVKVMSGENVRGRIPVALVSERTLDCLFSLSAEAEEQGRKELRRDYWLRRIYDSLQATADRVRELNELGKQAKRRDALEKAREGLKSLEADLESLSEEKDRLAKEGGLDLAEGAQRLEDLRKRQKELKEFVTGLGKIIKEEKDPKKQELLAQIERARLLEKQAEFQQAIDLYEKVLKESPKQTKVRQRLMNLRKAWAAQDAKHKEAREYIYQTWPRPVPPGVLKVRLAEVRQAFQVCQQKGDALTPQKILRANVAHADGLKKRLAALRPQTREDDRKEAKTIAEAAEGLQKLHDDVTAYLKKEKPAFP